MNDDTRKREDVGNRGPLEEGELYTVRKGHLEKIPRNDEDGMRKVRITEDAFEAAMEVGKRMRSELGGYKPDVSLVTSALVIDASRQVDNSKEVVRNFVVTMFEKGASSEAS